MNKNYAPPLAINFVWHPSDIKFAAPILDAIRKSFSRDKEMPFSRCLNIPLFYFSSQEIDEIPTKNPADIADVNIIFVFTSENTIGRKTWREYVEKLPTTDFIKIIPIAINRNGLNHNGSLAGLNCIRSYDWPKENRDLHSTVILAHEIYRFGFVSINTADTSKKSSISIFLSHAKSGDTGRLNSEEIKRFIDNTNMNRFFDATEISPGFSFSEEIEKYIPESTLLVIESDAYSSRYWCQKEILIAKKFNRPIVVLNCMEEYEDRIFPAASNVPRIHVSADTPISDRDILRALTVTIIETIRFNYSIKCLEKYKGEGWIDDDCEITARPPEIRQVLALKNQEKKKICYPDPPIYSDEADWHKLLDIQTFTPLWNKNDQNSLENNKIGISISEVENDGYLKNNFHSDYLIRLTQDLSRHLLARSATLIYGGDLRPNGFTEFILEEATILNDRLKEKNLRVVNYLAWPLHVSSQEVVEWRAKYSQVMDTKECDIPVDVANGLPRDIFLPPNTTKNSYIWSRCLTEMRKESIFSSTSRICAGGKLTGFKGKMPGVLEEIILALEAKKPLYLLGAFGGVVAAVCEVMLNHEIPDTLTEEWQTSHNGSYSELQKYASFFNNGCDYESVTHLVSNINISELSARCGLDSSEYIRLMQSPFIDECIHLIIKGLNKLNNTN